MKNRSKYTKELIEPLVSSSVSFSQVIAKLGLRNTGGNYRMIHSKIQLYRLDTSHFLGQGWANGLTRDTSKSIDNATRKKSYSNDEVFIVNSPLNKGSELTKRLLKLGWEYRCKLCGINEWAGKKLRLHLD